QVITIAGVPSWATLSAGSDNGDGTWTLNQGQLTGLTLTADDNASGDINLTVTATASEDGTTANTAASFTVAITGIADTPTVTVGDIGVDEDAGAIALNICALSLHAALPISQVITIAGVPSWATLSAGS